MSEINFEQLNLSPELLRAVGDLGFEEATEIQAQAIPLLQAGYDVVGRSQTGTGKTLAFGIPAVERIDGGPDGRHVQVLVVCPTRELSMQACAQLRKLAKYKPGVKAADIYGGAPMSPQIRSLREGANLVVGTPGRIMDHLRRGTLHLDRVGLVVLDEADEMLSMGFQEDIQVILETTPEAKQVALFSATMPPEIMAVIDQYQRDPQVLQIGAAETTVEAIRQQVYQVPMGYKPQALEVLLRWLNPRRSMIFCNTKTMTEEVAELLQKKGFSAEALHGDMKQPQRTAVLGAFKNHRTHLLVATDVAARGIDVDNVDYVINYDIPQNSEYYIHRVGRTGRAGREGCAITLCCGRRQAMTLAQIVRAAKSQLEECSLPTPAQVEESRALRREEEVLRALEEEPVPAYGKLVERLTEQGVDLSRLAQTLLTLHYGREEALRLPHIPDLPAPRAAARVQRGREEDMARIVLSVGRQNNISPNHIVGAVAEFAGIPGKVIGKIQILEKETVVALPREVVKDALRRLNRCRICGWEITAREYQERRENDRHGRPPRRDDRRENRRDGRWEERPDRRRNPPMRARREEEGEKDYRHLSSQKNRRGGRRR